MTLSAQETLAPRYSRKRCIRPSYVQKPTPTERGRTDTTKHTQECLRLELHLRFCVFLSCPCVGFRIHPIDAFRPYVDSLDSGFRAALASSDVITSSILPRRSRDTARTIEGRVRLTLKPNNMAIHLRSVVNSSPRASVNYRSSM